MANLGADLLGGFAFASRGPGFVGGDANGRKRRAVHASECYEFAVLVGYCNNGGLLLLERSLHDEVHDSFRILVVDCKSALHLLSSLAIRRLCTEHSRNYVRIFCCSRVSNARSSLWPCHSLYLVPGLSVSSTPKGPRKFHNAKPLRRSPTTLSVSFNHARTTCGGVCL